MIWVLSTMLWYESMTQPQQSDYMLKTFENKTECQQFIRENKVELVEQLLREMKNVNGYKLKTFEYFCKKEKLLEV